MTTDPIIAPNGDAWPDPAATAAKVATLETQLGSALPEPYRNFLVSTDGGAPYPLIFEDPRDPADPYRFLDRFNSTDFIARAMSGEIYSGGEPKGYVIIGEDPGGLVVVLSLQPADLGAVYIWESSTAPWGTGENTAAALIPLAPDFASFVQALYDTPDRMGWTHWAIPIRERLQRPLVLVGE